VPKNKNYQITGYATEGSLASQKAEQYRAASPLCVLQKQRNKHFLRTRKPSNFLPNAKSQKSDIPYNKKIKTVPATVAPN
jgi:hypothetical protein